MPRPKPSPENAPDKRSVSPRAFVVRAAEAYIAKHPHGTIRDLSALIDYALCRFLEADGQGALLIQAADELRGKSSAHDPVVLRGKPAEAAITRPQKKAASR